MWNPETRIITDAPSVTELSIHMKGSVHGWTSTKAKVSLPASHCCAFWPQPQSLSVASSASELRDTPHRWNSQHPESWEIRHAPFYAVMMVLLLLTVIQPLRGARVGGEKHPFSEGDGQTGGERHVIMKRSSRIAVANQATIHEKLQFMHPQALMMGL